MNPKAYCSWCVPVAHSLTVASLPRQPSRVRNDWPPLGVAICVEALCLSLCESVTI
jgi:hypothetical protein